MAMKPTPPAPFPDRYVDIHQIPAEEEVPHLAATIPVHDQRRATKFRDQRRPQKSFSRQVSLETGFSALNRESKANKNEGRVLSRSGNSFGGFASGNRSGEARKGDFSIFRTKSTLHKQSSMLPVKEGWVDSQRADGLSGLEESNNQSVPNAGRYFAALRGPELDQVKVIFSPILAIKIIK